MGKDDALAALAEVGITDVDVIEAGDPAAVGTVLGISPSEGSEIQGEGAVTLTVAVAEAAEMPDLVGELDSAAISALADLGINDVTTQRIPSVQPTGSVLGSQPEAGREVSPGTAVVLTVADPLETPNFLDQSLEDARTQAEALGATVVVDEVYTPGIEAGALISQEPAPGEQMTETLTLQVGEAPGILLLEDLGYLDRSNGKARFDQGEVDGETYIHALVFGGSYWDGSWIEFNLSRDFDTLRFTAGYSDNGWAEGDIRLEIFVDGTPLYVHDYRLGDGEDEVSVPLSDGLRLRVQATSLANTNNEEWVVLGQAELLGDPDVVSQYYE
jgi:hypothetical protein